MEYFFYNLLLSAALLVSVPLIPFLPLLGERFYRGLGQRFAFYPRAVTAVLGSARPIWIHAASVGEVEAAGRLTHELRRQFPERKIVLSTFTAAGNLRARQIDAADAVVFLPFDQIWIVRRALAQLNPSLLIFLETEIWPTLLREAYRKGLPTLLLSGRLSAKSLKRYARLPAFFRRVLQCYSAIGMQSHEDAERILELGAEKRRLFVIGNLKRAPAATQVDANGKRVKNGGKPQARRKGPLLVVGSSHRGEEEILLNVFIALKAVFSDLQLALAPRHPQRFSEVGQLLRAKGLDFECLSQQPRAGCFSHDVMLVDTVGDLVDWYAMGDVAFVGGSLVDAGGHNLLEPARFRKPVLFGPFMENFQLLAAEMKASGGGIEVRSGEDLIEEITQLLADPQKRRAVGEKAYRVAAEDPGVLRQSVALAQRYLQTEVQT